MSSRTCGVPHTIVTPSAAIERAISTGSVEIRCAVVEAWQEVAVEVDHPGKGTPSMSISYLTPSPSPFVNPECPRSSGLRPTRNADLAETAVARSGGKENSGLFDYPEEVDSTQQAGPKARPLARLARLTGTLLIVLGVGFLAWTLCVWRWNDPFTSTYTRWQQHKLASVNQQIFAEFRPTYPGARKATPHQQSRAMARDAAHFRKRVSIGDPIGRLRVPRLGLNILMINGTDTTSLKSGPGRDKRTFMPGQGELVYIAGHRTTYGAPFAHIDRLRAGDRVTLEMPYATIEYAVVRERIVDDQDLSVLKSADREEVALQACHPRFWATQRYVVWAKPVRARRGDSAPFIPATLE